MNPQDDLKRLETELTELGELERENAPLISAETRHTIRQRLLTTRPTLWQTLWHHPGRNFFAVSFAGLAVLLVLSLWLEPRWQPESVETLQPKCPYRYGTCDFTASFGQADAPEVVATATAWASTLHFATGQEIARGTRQAYRVLREAIVAGSQPEFEFSLFSSTLAYLDEQDELTFAPVEAVWLSSETVYLLVARELSDTTSSAMLNPAAIADYIIDREDATARVELMTLELMLAEGVSAETPIITFGDQTLHYGEIAPTVADASPSFQLVMGASYMADTLREANTPLRANGDAVIEALTQLQTTIDDPNLLEFMLIVETISQITVTH